MAQPALNDRTEGYTLLEVLISLIIFIVIFMAALSAINYYLFKNMENILRDEAVKISQECAENLRALIKCTNSTSSNATITDTIKRKIGDATFDFTITYPNPDSFVSGNNDVKIIVSYKFKNRNYNQILETTVYAK